MKEMIELNPKLCGWCTLDKAITLYNLVLATQPDVIVEIGVYGGRSAIPMMFGCRENGKGIVHCVDPWDAEASKLGQVTDVDKEWWGKLDHEMIYQSFLKHLRAANLENQCKIHRKTSRDFDAPPKIDILHTDGNHGPDAISDTLKFSPNVKTGGYVVLDDLGWSGGHVQKSAAWLKENGFLELHPLGTGALFRRMR